MTSQLTHLVCNGEYVIVFNVTCNIFCNFPHEVGWPTSSPLQHAVEFVTDGALVQKVKKVFDSYSLLYPNTVVCIFYFKYILDFVGNNTLGLKLLLYNYIPGGNVNFVKVLSIISVCHIRYYLLLSIYTKPHWHILFRVNILAVLGTDMMWGLEGAMVWITGLER